MRVERVAAGDVNDDADNECSACRAKGSPVMATAGGRAELASTSSELVPTGWSLSTRSNKSAERGKEDAVVELIDGTEAVAPALRLTLLLLGLVLLGTKSSLLPEAANSPCA
jgi:hypothetical protein